MGGGIQLIYVFKETRNLTKKLYKYTCKDYHNIDDTPSIIQNHSTFKEHRHDQSLFNLKNNLILLINLLFRIYLTNIFKYKL